MEQVLILGAGVMGLSAAITLERAGIRTRIVARDLPPRTTSNIAAAIWQPFKADPLELILDCGRIAFGEYVRLASEAPASGVIYRDGAAVFPHRIEQIWYHDLVPNYRRLAAGDPLLRPGYVDGYAFRTLVVETPIYMPWLLKTYREMGGEIELRALGSIEEALAVSDVVVNCTGLGSRELVPDAATYPARGQLVRIPQFGLERFWLDDDNAEGICYIVPRSKDIICGGTFEPHDERLTPDLEAAQAIVRRAARLEPRVAEMPILEHLVGLRPCRPLIRLEGEDRGEGKTVVHNYGHGGSGVTISWGCAQQVLRLVRAALDGG